MEIEKVTSAAAPSAVGPYSQAVRAGEFLFTAGQIALSSSGESLIGGDDIGAQTAQVMKNLAAILSAAGVDFSAVIKTTIYLVDLSDFEVVNRVYGRFFGENPPARATVGVAALPKGAAVEIDLVAAL